MAEIRKSDVEEVLKEFKDPETGRSVMETGQVTRLEVAEGRIAVTLGLTSMMAPIAEDIRAALHVLLQGKFSEAEEIAVGLASFDRPPVPKGQVGLTAKKVIAVGSGKGGVGKSTVAVGLASTLHRMGARVGLLDADVYGPSVPHLLGLHDGAIRATEEGLMIPVDCGGMPVHSIGFLVPKDEAVVWRGPMLHGSLLQMLGKTVWGNLDYLIIDMPPGTGDVPLSLSQVIGPDGVVVVCTPQPVALLDAVKAISMFRRVRIPVLGMVENMSGFLCPDCGKTYAIFGSGGAREEAERQGVPLLGQIPLHIPIREWGDVGQGASMAQDPQVAPHFERIAYQIVKRFADEARSNPPALELPVIG